MNFIEALYQTSAHIHTDERSMADGIAPVPEKEHTPPLGFVVGQSYVAGPEYNDPVDTLTVFPTRQLALQFAEEAARGLQVRLFGNAAQYFAVDESVNEQGEVSYISRGESSHQRFSVRGVALDVATATPASTCRFWAVVIGQADGARRRIIGDLWGSADEANVAAFKFASTVEDEQYSRATVAREVRSRKRGGVVLEVYLPAFTPEELEEEGYEEQPESVTFPLCTVQVVELLAEYATLRRDEMRQQQDFAMQQARERAVQQDATLRELSDLMGPHMS